jgi:hypothetical protein
MEEIKIPTVQAIKALLDPIYDRLEAIEKALQNKNAQANYSGNKKYYRNNDLKAMFGLSNNTLIKYRDTGILPYTKIGDLYLYEVQSIDRILLSNKVSLNT